MNLRSRENRIKLHLLESFAISERALANLLTRVAQEESTLPLGASDQRAVQRRLAAIARCQEALLGTIGGIRVRSLRHSPPGPIWYPERKHEGRRKRLR